jgi:branched-chain amino acid transport system substrate-binding protein
MKKLIFALIAFFLLSAGIAAEQAPIRIGLMAPLTGAWASEGQEMKRVVDLLAEELNARGGVGGKPVAVIAEDDGGDPRTAALAAERLATREVKAVVGAYGSAVTEASQGILDEARIVQLANGSTATRLTEKGLKYFFRVCPRDDEQARSAAAAIHALGVRRLAILHDSSTYAKGLADAARARLAGSGEVDIVFFDALTPKEQDYTAILTKIKAVRPDLVFFTGYWGEAGLLLRQKKEMGWEAPFLGGDANNNADLVKIAGKDAAAGFRFLSAPLPKDLSSVEAKSFLASYKQKYGEAPGSIYALLAGDAFRIAAAALEAVKSGKGDDLADYLHKNVKDFPGLTGKISFDEKGDRVGEVYRTYKINTDGSFVLE